MTIEVHILDEVRSTPTEMTSFMWCNVATIELYDGTFIPHVDYCFEAQAEFATCEACLKAFKARTVKL